MADERKAMLGVGVDATDARQGFQEVKDAGRDMAQGVQTSAQQTAKAIDSIGSGGAKAAQGVDASAKSIINSIQRTTAAAQAGEKGTAAYYEALAKQRGISQDVLRPYLEQLRQVEAAHKAATGTLGGIGVSAGQTAAALRGVPAQFTDIIVSLQGGQAPLTVFLQQGGQLKDMFGGAGEAAKALGGYVLGLINPFTVAGAAAGVFYLAYEQTRKETVALDAALIHSGNIIGTTTGQLSAMADELSGSEFSRSGAVKALAEIATSGAVARDELQSLTKTALDMEKYVGQPVSETVKIFKSLADEPTKATFKLSEGLHYLTLAQYEHIQALEKQGKKTDAAREAQQAYADAVKPAIDAYKANLGPLETALNYWTGKAKGMWDALRGAGETSESRIAGVRAQIEALNGANPFKNVGLSDAISGIFDPAGTKNRLQAGLQEQLTYLERVTQAAKDSAKAEGDRQRTQEAGIAAMDSVSAAQSKGLSKTQQMNVALEAYRANIEKIRAANPDSALLDAKKIAAGESAIREQFKEAAKSQSAPAGESELAGIQAKAEATRDYLKSLREQGLVAQEQNEAERTASKLQKELAGGVQGVARANKEKALAVAQAWTQDLKAVDAAEKLLKSQRDFESARDKEASAIQSEIAKIEEKARALEDEIAAYGLGEQALASMAIARLEEKKAAIAQFDGSDERIAQIDAEIAARKRYAQAGDQIAALKIDAGTDDLLRNAKQMAVLYEDELRLSSLSAVEREKLVAQRQVELKYAKELAKIEASSISEPDKQVQRIKLNEAQQIESSAAINKVIQDDFAKTSDQINQSLTDALMRGFEGGKEFAGNLRDTVVNMFKTMVLRPIVSAIVSPVSGMIGSAAQSVMGGVGGGGGGIFGSLAGSAAGTFFSGITTAVSAGFKGATLGVGMMGPTTAGAGGAMGFGNALAAIPGWGWALAGIAALAGLGIGKTPGEQHAGGLFSTSGSVGMDAAMRVTGGGGWDDGAWARDLVKRADGAINQSLTQVGEGLVQTFAQINELAGGLVSEFDLTLGFAANLNGEGKDKNSFGYFDLTDKTTGEVITSYQNRELGTDNQAAMAKLSDDAARAMLDALAKANVPQWAQNVLKDLESVPGLQAMQEFLAYPQKLADSFGIAKQSMADDIATGFTSGDGEAAGAALATTVLSGIQSSIVGAASQQISTLVTNVILTPILSALANAQDPADALAAIDFDAVIAKAEGIGEGLADVFANPRFASAMDQLDATLRQVGQSAVGAAGDLQLIAQSADAVAAAPAPAPVPTPAQASSGGGGGGARDIPVGGFVDPNVYRIDLTDIAQQTADALDKIAESIKNLGKVTPQAYAAIDEQARQKFSELNGDYLAGLVDFGEQSRAQYVALGKIGAEIQAFYDASGAWSNISAGQAEELIDKLRKSSDLPVGLVDQLYAGYGTDYSAFFDSLSLYVMGLQNSTWQAGEGLEGNKNELDALNQQIKEWTLAQKRLLATDELVSLATEAADATAKIEELKRTGGLTDPITQLKELYAKKLTDIDAGINAALQAEIDQKKGTAADYADYSTQLDDFLKNGRGQFGTQQEYEDFIAKGKEIMGDSFMGAMVGGANPWPEILQKMINELNTDVSAMTAEQQSYIKGLEDWYAVQKELLATEMLVDINRQIRELEAPATGPLQTIKDAITKYAKDLADLGQLTAEAQAALDKLSGLQLDAARKSLYDQLLSQDELRGVQLTDLQTQFADLGATMPATTDGLRAMIDAARAAGNTTLADTLLELVPAFVSLQGAADGVGAKLQSATDAAFAALERAVGVQRDLLTESITHLQAVFDMTRDAARDLYGDVESTSRQSAAAGMAFIDQALANAQASGYMPDADGLSEAIDSVRNGLSQQSAATAFEAERDRLVLAGKLTELKDLAEPQLTEAQRQLAALEEMLETARAQIDELRGINTSVLSVADAMTALAAAIAAEKAAAAPSAGGGGGGYVSSPINSSGSHTGIGDSGYRLDGNTLYFPGGGSHTVAGAGGAQILLDTYGLQQGGLNGTLVRTRAMGGYTPPGLTLVGEEGPELVNFQAPSMVYTAAQTAGLMGGGNAEMVAELRALRAEVAALRAAGERTASNTAQMPQLAEQFDNVTEGGNAIRSEVMA